MGDILLGGLLGALLGVAVALLGGRISSAVLQRKGESGIMAAMAARLALDAAALGAVFLARRALPLPFEPTIIGTALGLSLTGILLGWRLSRRLAHGGKAADTEGGE